MGVMITSAAVVIYPHMKPGGTMGSDEAGGPIPERNCCCYLHVHGCGRLRLQ